MKIAAIQYSKSKIQLAKADYERKLQTLKTPNGSFIKERYWNVLFFCPIP